MGAAARDIAPRRAGGVLHSAEQPALLGGDAHVRRREPGALPEQDVIDRALLGDDAGQALQGAAVGLLPPARHRGRARAAAGQQVERRLGGAALAGARCHGLPRRGRPLGLRWRLPRAHVHTRLDLDLDAQRPAGHLHAAAPDAHGVPDGPSAHRRARCAAWLLAEYVGGRGDPGCGRADRRGRDQVCGQHTQDLCGGARHPRHMLRLVPAARPRLRRHLCGRQPP
eukprot:scaffold32750_cov66-Phaeocystis_antarctica.AAC.2